MYEYQATVIRVVDGNTIHLEVDLGFDIAIQSTFRFLGINAPEQSTPEGKLATSWLKEKCPPGTKVRIQTVKDRKEKFGRYLATVFLDEVNINQALIEAGLASVYP